MRRSSLFLVALLALALGVFGLSRGTSSTQADPAIGDWVGSVTFSVNCESGLGVGIAYDGTNLWYSCYEYGTEGSKLDLHRADPSTGLVSASYDIVPNGGLGALSYDATRNAIWAGEGGGGPGGGPIYRIDLDAGKNVTGSALVFPTGDLCGLDDGLAFDARNAGDPTDDVLYYSDDCLTATIDVYPIAGGPPVESFPWGGSGCYNSGLAVGGQLLYQGSDGCSHVWVVDKTSKAPAFDFPTIVPSDPNFRDEDLECDTNTFAGLGLHVMWSKEAYNPMRAHAFEIEFNSCGVGGQPAVPEITLDLPTAENPAGTSHTITATITAGGQPVPGVLVGFEVAAGPNAGQVSDPGECSVDPNCYTDANGQVSWTYTSNGAVGTDIIVACFTDDAGEIRCARATKEWVDRTPPAAACIETVNPHGNNVPPAGRTTLPGPKGGQNEDGFYELLARDNVDPNPQIFVVDSGSGTIFGPFSSGTKIKYTQAAGATPSQKPIGSANGQAGAVSWHITGTGDAVIVAVDAAGNVSDRASCLVPPPPK